jgi:hypothetical protein
MKRYRLWFKQGTTRVEDLGVGHGKDEREALENCLGLRNQTIALFADRLGLSEDQYLSNYIEAEELNGRSG